MGPGYIMVGPAQMREFMRVSVPLLPIPVYARIVRLFNAGFRGAELVMLARGMR